ncbi:MULTISPECIES: hypothetical protein [unclassified Streptomyces]|uniref:hypothetical protein n=1 Tax=unclassified Streptomyces TaxID=2593676 RepID=UPI002E12D173|nr:MULTISPECIES: hypothetical protein [unclassified Streptomyces]WSR29447.1 hypothetical protein OG573_43530 [Streptomyces sp. NBC_01205]
MQFKKAAMIALGAFAVLGSSPAMAYDINSYKDGAVHAYSYGTNTRVAVSDTKQDGHPVYVNYKRETSSDLYTLWNKSGNGTTITSASGGMIYVIQACVSIDAWPDSCDSNRE